MKKFMQIPSPRGTLRYMEIIQRDYSEIIQTWIYALFFYDRKLCILLITYVQ